MLWFGQSSKEEEGQDKRENNVKPKMLKAQLKLLFVCHLFVGQMPEPMRETKLLKDGE